MIQENLTYTSLGDPIAAVLFLPDGPGPYPALVACHGALAFKENLFELCEYLSGQGLACLALDMHGHGGSGGERYHVDMRQWVPDVIAALDCLSADPRIDSDRLGAFGHSSGGTAILEAALGEPRLKVLIGLDATVRNSFHAMETLVLQALNLAGRAKKAITGRDLRLSMLKLMGGTQAASDPQVDRQLRQDPRFIEAFSSFPLPGAVECFFVDTIKRVGGIGAPTLVLWGADDQLDPPETARILFDALTCEKELHIIPGNGHTGHCDRNMQQVFDLTAGWVRRYFGL